MSNQTKWQQIFDLVVKIKNIIKQPVLSEQDILILQATQLQLKLLYETPPKVPMFPEEEQDIEYCINYTPNS
jgi:hypothetical protein